MNGLLLHCHLTIRFSANFLPWFYLPQWEEFFVYLNVSSCIDCYLKAIRKDFILFKCCKYFLDCYPRTFSRIFLIFCFNFTNNNGKEFLYFVKCKQMYYLLPHHYCQGFFVLFICSVITNEAKTLPKISVPQD